MSKNVLFLENYISYHFSLPQTGYPKYQGTVTVPLGFEYGLKFMQFCRNTTVCYLSIIQSLNWIEKYFIEAPALIQTLRIILYTWMLHAVNILENYSRRNIVMWQSKWRGMSCLAYIMLGYFSRGGVIRQSSKLCFCDV